MNTLKKRLMAGDFVGAAWAELGNSDVVEIMVHQGWDVIVIDGEHGVGELEAWVAMARAIEAAGGEVVLRVPDGDETLLKRVLDRGFRSLIVPMVNSVAQAEAVASYCRYPSRGRRGYGAPIVRASNFGVRENYACQDSHEELLLMVQCEHPDAVAALPEIAAVDGVDVIFVGPNDLSAALGHLEDMEHPETQAALAEIEAKAKAAGTVLATVPGAGRGWRDLKALGYGLVAGPADVQFVAEGAGKALRDITSELAS